MEEFTVPLKNSILPIVDKPRNVTASEIHTDCRDLDGGRFRIPIVNTTIPAMNMAARRSTTDTPVPGISPKSAANFSGIAIS